MYDAIVYANSKNYLNNSVKQVNIFHENGVDYNMKIGKYRNSNSLQSLESNNILKNTNEKMTYSTNNICNAIKSINNDFDLKDYSVSESSGIIICPENGQIIDSNNKEVNVFLDSLMENEKIVCEFGIGMNPNIHSLCGYTVLDEKMKGTFHIAIGANTMFGGKNNAPNHIDLVGVGKIEYVKQSYQ